MIIVTYDTKMLLLSLFITTKQARFITK